MGSTSFKKIQGETSIFCSKCGTQLPDNSVVCSKCGKRQIHRSYLKVAIGATSLIIVLVIAGYFVKRQMKLSAFDAKLEEVIRKDAGYTETIIVAEDNASSMSYQEILDLCDKSIEERTNLIVELRGTYPENQGELKSKLISFLNSENELIRQESRLYHSESVYSLSNKSLRDAKKDYDSSHNSYDLERLKRNITEVENAMYEMAGNNLMLVSSYNAVLEEESGLKTAMDQGGIHFVQKYQESNRRGIANQVQNLVNTTAKELGDTK